MKTEPSKNGPGKQTFLFILILLVGIGAGWLIKAASTDDTSGNARQVREKLPGFDYINPLLYTETKEDTNEYKPLDNTLSDYVDTVKSQKLADSVSVYFRDLNSGKWTGVNEDVLYEPSSMLKVLVMMSYFRKNEEDSTTFSKYLTYKSVDDPGQSYKPEHSLASGPQTVKDLVNQMIIDSDNQAVLTLMNANIDGFDSAFSSLQLPQPSHGNLIDYMSPKSYSVLFRTLYNSTYLSHPDSEKALELLAKTTFTEGLVAGVPKGVNVSHKFGEHTTITTSGEVVSRELHDCGIIYRADDPYFLCVMTKGTDFSNLQHIISSISKIVYENNITK